MRLVRERSSLDLSVQGVRNGTLAGVSIVVTAAGLGVLSVLNTNYAVFAALAVVILALTFIDLALVPVMAIPATLVMVRAGGFLSVSDVVLAGAVVVAIVLISQREALPMQPLIWLGVTYLATMVPSLVLNPFQDNIVEWVHEVFLVIGGLIVGFVVGREGYARAALTTYVIACSGIAVAAAVTALLSFAQDGAFSPAYLPYMHKNFIGNMLSFAFVIVYSKPPWLRHTARWGYWTMALCTVGMAASQSRQAIIATVVGIVVVMIREHRRGLQAKLMVAAAIPSAWVVVRAVQDQLASGNEFNSANQRLSWYADSIEVWHQSPLFGVGQRWWYTGDYGFSFQPPNAELEMLTVGGVVGLLGFFVMFFGAMWVLWHMDPRYGTVALAVVVTRFAQGQFDLYWVAGQATFLWMVAGMAFGVQALDAANGKRGEGSKAWQRFSAVGPRT